MNHQKNPWKWKGYEYFDIMWNKIESDIEEVIKQNTKNGTNKKSNDGIQDIEPLEEILRILRQNNAILSIRRDCFQLII